MSGLPDGDPVTPGREVLRRAGLPIPGGMFTPTPEEKRQLALTLDSVDDQDVRPFEADEVLIMSQPSRTPVRTTRGGFVPAELGGEGTDTGELFGPQMAAAGNGVIPTGGAPGTGGVFGQFGQAVQTLLGGILSPFIPGFIPDQSGVIALQRFMKDGHAMTRRREQFMDTIQSGVPGPQHDQILAVKWAKALTAGTDELISDPDALRIRQMLVRNSQRQIASQKSMKLWSAVQAMTDKWAAASKRPSVVVNPRMFGLRAGPGVLQPDIIARQTGGAFRTGSRTGTGMRLRSDAAFRSLVPGVRRATGSSIGTFDVREGRRSGATQGALEARSQVAYPEVAGLGGSTFEEAGVLSGYSGTMGRVRTSQGGAAAQALGNAGPLGERAVASRPSDVTGDRLGFPLPDVGGGGDDDSGSSSGGESSAVE